MSPIRSSCGFRFIPLALLTAALLAGCSPPAHAQAVPSPAATATPAPPFASRQLLVAGITGLDAKQVVLMQVSLAPGATSPAHRHPGDCFGSVVDGVIELRVQGQAPRRVEAGQSYVTADGVAHEFTNIGDTPVRLLNTLVVDKGQPSIIPTASPNR